LFGCWNVAVALGVLAGTALHNTGSLGLDAAFPTVLLALVLPALADRGTRNAALAGAVIAVAATPFLPAGLPVLLALAGLVLAGRPAAREEAGEEEGRPADANPALEAR
jgi:predicted branched-subunit amino acid permease